MRIYWWQGGVFIHPETTTELSELGTLVKSLERGLKSTDGLLTLRALSFFGKSLATAKVGRSAGDLGVPPVLIIDDEEKTEEA